jgi:Flp pilus assembly pilin Flp
VGRPEHISEVNRHMKIENLVDMARRLLATADRGQTLVEYALIIVFISLGTLAALTFVRTQIEDVFTQIGNLL